MSFINPSMGDSKPRPLSPKAVDLLQEIQSKFQQNQKQNSSLGQPSSPENAQGRVAGADKALDNIPTLVKKVDISNKQKAQVKEGVKELPDFDKNEYLSDTRSNKVFALVGSTFILVLLLIGGYSLVVDYLVPSFLELKTLSMKSNAAASDASKVSNQIKGLKDQLSTEKDHLSSLIDQFPSLNETYTTYSAFLSALESSHVILVNQQATVTQTPNHPFIYTSVTDEKNSFKPLDVAKRNGLNNGTTTNAAQATTSQPNQANNKNSAAPTKSGAQQQQPQQPQQSQAQAATNNASSNASNNASKSTPGQGSNSSAGSNNQKGSAKDLVVTGEVKQGLNYYHLEMILKGSYVNYLFARQSLINAIPNSIVHRELIRSGSNSADPLEIKLYLSIPFLSDKGETT